MARGRLRIVVVCGWPGVVYGWPGFSLQAVHRSEPGRRRFTAVHQDGSEGRLRQVVYGMLQPVHVPAVSLRELTGTTALKACLNRRWPGAVYKYWAWCSSVWRALQLCNRDNYPRCELSRKTAETPRAQFLDKVVHMTVLVATTGADAPDSAETRRGSEAPVHRQGRHRPCRGAKETKTSHLFARWHPRRFIDSVLTFQLCIRGCRSWTRLLRCPTLWNNRPPWS